MVTEVAQGVACNGILGPLGNEVGDAGRVASDDAGLLILPPPGGRDGGVGTGTGSGSGRLRGDAEGRDAAALESGTVTDSGPGEGDVDGESSAPGDAGADVAVCPPSCTADLECAAVCPEVLGAINCCDLVTHSCFQSAAAHCPDQDDGVGPDSGASSYDGGEGSVPTTCAEADGVAGCCGPNETNYYCTSSAPTTVVSKRCPSGTVCTWGKGPQGAYLYECLEAAISTSDPSGTYPILCL
jgi:hypothetical protein